MVLFILIELPSKDFVSNKVCGSAVLSCTTPWCSYLCPVMQLDRLFAASEKVLGQNQDEGCKLMGSSV